MGNSVTYKGPVDRLDPSTHFLVPVADGDDVEFAKGVPVSDVPDAVVDVLRSEEVAAAHEFDVSSAKSQPKANLQAEAKSLGIEFTDKTTVPELEAAIKAKHAESGE